MLAVCCALAMQFATLSGCGGEASPTGPAQPQPATRSAAEQARAEARAQARAEARAKALDRRRLIALERTFAPNPWRQPGASAAHGNQPLKHLIVHDVKRGTGPPLRGDETVYVDYVLRFWTTGRTFLDEWHRPGGTGLTLSGQYAGLRRGMIGMRLGGRRTIEMPHNLADAHDPTGGPRMEAVHADIVLRKIVQPPGG